MSDVVSAFDPTKNKYAYHLDKFSCFRKLTGKCSLDLTEREVEYYTSLEGKNRHHNKSSVHHCRLLAESIKSKGVTEYVWIHPHSCDHYSFTWGQHRTCIAKRIGLNNIPALIGSAWESDCRVCGYIRTSLIFRLMHWLNKTDEFVR
ncbi:hypothetical protein GCM10023310_69860 [Paenibacillus vulneris]|uniref:ParB N-terminal domain-containing protein n=1 Tax=Paenibacillus vulneris TaxID=1133364 RepID=A0ABW3UJ09_9BACL